MIEAIAQCDTLDVTTARERLAEIVERVRRSGDRVEIEANGKTVAVIVSARDLRRLQDLDARWEAGFEAAGRISDAFADVPVDELERQVERALKEARAKMRAEREAASKQ